MTKDRRQDERADSERRHSGRISDYRLVCWHEGEPSDGNDANSCSGVLVEWSARGVVLLTEGRETPRPGARLVPRKRPDVRGWLKPTVVTSIKPLPGGLRLVVAEFADVGAE